MTAPALGDDRSADGGASPRGLLAVDGIDGSGKSVLARKLAEVARDLRIDIVTLAVDDFRRPVDFSASDRQEADIYYQDYYDLPLLDACLRAFLAGASGVDIPVFDARAHRLDGQRRLDFGAARIAVVEGVFALRVATIARGAAVIYLRTSFPEARRRIRARDTARGRTLADVNHRIDARYFPAQERYLREQEPAARAHVLIENEDLSTPSLSRFDADGVRARFNCPPAADDVTPLLRRTFSSFATPGTVG